MMDTSPKLARWRLANWWCRRCGWPFRGGNTLVAEMVLHMQQAHGAIALADRQN